MTDLPRRVHLYVLLTAGVSLLALAANTVAIALDTPPRSLATGVASLVFVVGFLLLERNAVTLAWRHHRVSTALTETAVFLGFFILEPTLVVLLVPIAFALSHFIKGRPAIKGVFNVAHGAVGAFVAGLAYVALDAPGMSPLVSAAAATLVYSVVVDAQLAGLFAILEDENPFTVYAQRFLMANALALATGIPAAIVLVALHGLAPLALLAAIPILYLLHRHTGLQARSDRELAFHRRLARDAQHLIGAREDDAVANQVLRTSVDLMDADHARLRHADGRVWRFPTTAPPRNTRPSLECSLEGRDGQLLGTLAVWERPGKTRFGEEEHALLHLIAGQAAHGFETASALAEVASQRDLIARQEKLSALGTLLAGVAHEINNPLSYMTLRIHTMRAATQRAVDAPEQHAATYPPKMLESIATIERGLERLGALSHSLKIAARPGNGTREPVDMNDIVTQVMTVVAVGHKNVAFDLRLDPTLAPLDANPAELHQVLLNLVKNAGESLDGRPDARIGVTTRSVDGHLVVEVSDNGPGIPADAQAKLFTPFFTTKQGGTGLGLSISHQIVEAHGGELTFESEPDKGTRFTMRLPVVGVPVTTGP